MSILTAANVVYMIQNSLTGEFLASAKGAPKFTADVWNVTKDGRLANREIAKKVRTSVRAALEGDVPAVAIDIVRVRADVRRGSLGRPRKVQESV